MSTMILGLACLLAAPAPKEAVKPAASIEGEWTVVALEGAPKEVVPGMVRFTFTADQIEVREGGRERVEKAKYSVDLKAKPATIDIMPGEVAKEKVVQGIIEISGDTMKLCFAKDGANRPTEFKGDPANGVAFFTLKRVKAEK